MGTEPEIILKYRGSWLSFKNPECVVSASDLHDVLPALKKVEELSANNNWYAAGFVSYEAGPAFDPAISAHPPGDFPLLWFALFKNSETITLPEPAASEPPQMSWKPETSPEGYRAGFDTIVSAITEGMTYQVNYTIRFSSTLPGDTGWQLFLHMARTQNRHAAYINTGRFSISSASPELFFEKQGQTITCKPMKGTAKRGRTLCEDEAIADWLSTSVKNRAENLMIVDMTRNDLGRMAKPGSVAVPILFGVEKYPTLWQMVSTVTAQTDRGISEIFTALFPSASITGAPKPSTSRIIQDVESLPRNIYTGSMGLITPEGDASFNVAIRTVLMDYEKGTAEYGAGGGIVWDSTREGEWDELLLKTRVLSHREMDFSLLETLLWEPERGFYLLDRHISRMSDSARYFDIPFDQERVHRVLEAVTEKRDPQRVRLLLDRKGLPSVTFTPFTATGKQMTATLNTRPVDSNDPFIHHKTTHRAVYEEAKARHPGFDEVLLFNRNRELTEFTIGNIAVRMDDELLTPPLSCGLLAGTLRAEQLAQGLLSERILHIDDIPRFKEIFLLNSVRGMTPVRLTKG